MKNYTNIVLTIIAICLTINILKDFNLINVANASSTLNNVIDVNIKSVNGWNLLNRNIPVEIKKVQ